MSRFIPVFAVLCGCSNLSYTPPRWMDPNASQAGRPVKPHSELHRVYRMAQLLGYQEITSPETLRLKDGREARMALLQRTRWTMRDPAQSTLGDLKRRSEYMRLPEKERLRHMERSDDFIQVWWFPAGKVTLSVLSLASFLVPTDKPHRSHRELVLLGHDERSVYYAYAPIHEWVRFQQVERLIAGEDPKKAVLRGLDVKDAENLTSFLCSDLLASWGKDALPSVEEAVSKAKPERGAAVRALGRSGEGEVVSALIRWAGSSDPLVAQAARAALVETPRPEAKSLYVSWINSDAGLRPVEPLLWAIIATKAEVGAPVLARVLANPESVREFRTAFTLLRERSGRPLPKLLLDAEGVVRRSGTPQALAAGGQSRVDGGVMVMLTVGDTEATAVVGLSLALTETKGGDPAVARAGVTVLKSLPAKAMETVVKHLARSLRGSDRFQVQRVVKEVQEAGGS
ncbi:MAG: HEAT repeat domain-containing protein [Polyangia bacterium]|nr:HEAT repeat domain-containing protein [Polyangia bacterium]